MTDELKGVATVAFTTSTYASWSVEMEALLRAKGLWKCTQVLAQDFMTTLGTLVLKKKDEIETKFDKALGTIQCFLDPSEQGNCSRKHHCQRCLEDTQGWVGRSRILYQDFLLTLLYITKLEEGSFDVDGCVKSMEAIWRRLNEVNLKLPEELMVLMTLTGLSPSFGTQRRIVECQRTFPWRFSRKTCDKKL